MTHHIKEALTVLRRKQVETRTGLSRATIYRYMAGGTFPKPINLGSGRAVGWIESEITAYLTAQVERSRKGDA